MPVQDDPKWFEPGGLPSKPKVYDRVRRRYTIHEFKTKKQVEVVSGDEAQAEARCIELHRVYGRKSDYFYRQT